MTPKYRIWHKGRKQMFMVSTIDFRQEKISYIDGSGFAGAFISFDDVILMQSTGLTDTNGVEIFEGDILADTVDDYAIYSHNERHQAKPKRKVFGGVFYKLSAAGFVCLNIDSADFQFAEKIGNIHQNPELLEK